MCKKVICLALVLSLGFALCSCSNISIYSQQHEPEDFILIRTIGLDRSDGLVTVTASTGTGLDKEPPSVFTASAKTLAEAISNIRYGHLHAEAYFSHISQIVLGEEAAKQGIEEYLDYFARNINMRLASNIYVGKGDTAAGLIEKANGGDVSETDMLTSIDEKAIYVLMGNASTCTDVLSGLTQRKTALITAIEPGKSMEITNEDAFGIYPKGYALIKDGKLTDYIDEYTSSGIGMIKNEITSGPLTVTAEDGTPITLNMTSLKTNISGSYSEETIERVNINVKASFNVESMSGGGKLSSEKERDKIETLASEELYNRIASAIVYARNEKTDVLGLSDALAVKNPYKFRKTEDRWEEVFPSVTVTVNVTSRLQRTYDILDTPNIQGE